MINIVLVTDRNYIQFAITTIYSVLKSTTEEILVKCFALGFSEDQLINYKNKFNNKSVKFISINDDFLKNIKTKNHVSKAAYLKIFLPEILEDTEKIIFLDSDLLVINDINKLWVQFDENYTIQAIWNPGYNYDNELIGLGLDEETFNSGVMLMNLEKMRINSDSKKLLNFIDEKNHLTKLNDQAAFNAIYAREWGRISLDWNVQNKFYFKKSSYLKLKRCEKKDLLYNPSIIHFTTNSKPWMFKNAHPRKAFFIENYEAVNGKLLYYDKNLISFLKKIKEFLNYCFKV